MSPLTFEQKKEIVDTVYELKQTQPKAYEIVKQLIIQLSTQKQSKEERVCQKLI